MATYHSSIVLKPEQADLIMHYLNDEPTRKSEALFSDNSMCFTAHFPGNYVMEVWCSGIGDWADWCTNKAYGEAFLFDEFEDEVEVIYDNPDFLSDWVMTHDGNEYITHVIVNKED